MKKLMIAGVVGLCAAVTFGLESANVVGYQTVTNGVYGFNFVAPTFLIAPAMNYCESAA